MQAAKENRPAAIVFDDAGKPHLIMVGQPVGRA